MKKPHVKKKEDQLLEDYILSMLSPEDRFSEEQKGESPVQLSRTVQNDIPHDDSFVPKYESTFDTRTASERFLDRPPELDARLKQVQSLLARIPAVLNTAPEVQQQLTVETKAESGSDFKTHSKRVPETQVEVKTEISERERLNSTTQNHHHVKDSSRTTQNLNWGSKTLNENRAQKLSRTQELLADDVTREVVRAREMLGNAFQTLIFDVGKLPLAVPLVKLGGIHAYSEEDITPIFGTPNWFKGLIPSEQGNIMLVDTAKYIMPEKYEQVKDQLQYKYAILLDDTRWALACTHVREAKTLTIDDIRWAQKGSRKEWFAGMVVQFMCALLEVDSLINALYRAGKKQK
jgi:purine-binding chemotaxis protein CheW